MALIVDSAHINGQTIKDYTLDQQLWIYNGMDATTTSEIYSKLKPEDAAKRIYKFVLGMQGPALKMMRRGFNIDMNLKADLIYRLELRYFKLRDMLNYIVTKSFDIPEFNHRSHIQLKKLFYDVMKLPVQYKLDKVKKERVPSCDREALEKLEPYFYAGPIIRFLFELRDLEKKVQVLRTAVSPDFRMRCSYNIVGTKFGRWSSSSDAFGLGTNLQNVTDEMREIFIPDPGFKIAYADLEQAESVCVAYLSNDQNYKAAIASGDLHTYVCRLIFPQLKWTGDIKKDKEIAKAPYYRMFDHRDIAKRGGHATNYNATPFTVATRLRIPRGMAEKFQADYFGGFPGIREWQASVGRQIGAHSFLETPLGRKIWFFDRSDADETLRQAIAAGPQSMTGDILNRGLYNVLYLEYANPQIIQLLGQVHDAIVFQYRPEYELHILPKVLEAMTIPVPVPGQGTMIIKTEVLVGWNWRKFDKEENPYGITKWTPGERDKRQPPKATYGNNVLDRRVCTAHQPLLVA